MVAKTVKQTAPTRRTPRRRPVIEKNSYKCFHCDMELVEDKFYNSHSVAYKSKMPICKECLIGLFKEYTVKYSSIHKAIFRICGLLDIYYYGDLIDKCCDTQKEKNEDDIAPVLTNYMRQINSLPQYRDLSFQDSDTQEKSANVEKFKTNSRTENEKFWGAGFTKQQYVILNESYERWARTSPHEVEGDIVILKNICKLDLQIGELALAGKDSSKVMSSLTNLIKLSGLDGKSRQKATDEEKSNQAFGVFIASIENYMPADLYADKKKYADWEGRDAYYKEQYIRPTRNMVENRRDFPSVEKYRR